MKWNWLLAETQQTGTVSENQGVRAGQLFAMVFTTLFLLIAFAFSQHSSDLRAFSGNSGTLGHTDAEQGQGPSRDALLSGSAQVRLAQAQRPQPIKWVSGSDDASDALFAPTLQVPDEATKSVAFWPLDTFHTSLIANSNRARAPPAPPVLILT